MRGVRIIGRKGWPVAAVELHVLSEIDDQDGKDGHG